MGGAKVPKGPIRSGQNAPEPVALRGTAGRW